MKREPTHVMLICMPSVEGGPQISLFPGCAQELIFTASLDDE